MAHTRTQFVGNCQSWDRIISTKLSSTMDLQSWEDTERTLVAFCLRRVEFPWGLPLHGCFAFSSTAFSTHRSASTKPTTVTCHACIHKLVSDILYSPMRNSIFNRRTHASVSHEPSTSDTPFSKLVTSTSLLFSCFTRARDRFSHSGRFPQFALSDASHTP